MTVHADNGGTDPARPDIPSVIISVAQVTYTQVGPTGATGASGTSGTSGSSGVNGISSGLVYYFDGTTASQTVPIGSLITNDLILSPNIGAQTTITTSNFDPADGETKIVQFVTPGTTLSTTTILPGLWASNLFAQRTLGSGTLVYWIVIDEMQSDGTTLIGNIATGSSASGTPITNTQNNYLYTQYVPQYTLASVNSRIRVSIYAVTTGNNTAFVIEMRDNTLSNIITTLAANLSGTSGTSGTSGLSGTSGTSGSSGSSGTGGTSGTSGTSFSSPYVGNLEIQGQAWTAIDNNGSTTATTTIDFNTSNVQSYTLNASTTFSLTNMNAGATYIVIVKQAAGASYTATFTGVLWSGGSAPTQTPTNNKYDVYTFIYDGTNIFGSYIQNF
jgi:hypothetical protein